MKVIIVIMYHFIDDSKVAFPFYLAENFNGYKEAMQSVLRFAKDQFGENFGGFLVGLGGLAMAFHYETLSYEADINVPGVLVIGSPVLCKSKAVELLLSILGMGDDASVGG